MIEVFEDWVLTVGVGNAFIIIATIAYLPLGLILVVGSYRAEKANTHPTKGKAGREETR